MSNSNLFRKRCIRAGLASLVLGSLAFAAPTQGADLDGLSGQCCAGLEERIAELESTVARSGNRKLELEIYGTVNQALLFWDDGRESNVYAVNNDNYSSSVAFDSEVELEDQLEGWSVGVILEFDVAPARSGDVSQNNDGGNSANILLTESSWWIAHKRLGRLGAGFTANSGASSLANENDLSGTEVAASVDVRDIGGAFALRQQQGTLTPLTWQNLIDPLDSPDGNVVTYDSPVIAGFTLSALWGEDDVWNIALGYERKNNQIGAIAAGIAYAENKEGEDEGTFDYRQLIGSFAFKHNPTGIHFLASAGWREFTETEILNSGAIATPDEVWFLYFKSGVIADLNRLGPTRFYAEYGRFSDFQANAIAVDAVSRLANIAQGNVCLGAGFACTSSASSASVWGLGIVQDIRAADAQIYLGYRHHEADINLIDVAGNRVSGGNIDDFDTVISGFILNF